MHVWIVVVRPLNTPLALLLLLAALLAGCAGSEMAAPVEDRQQPPSRSLRLHFVDREETLYSIAFRYESSVAELARINGLRSPYIIYPGQRLFLTSEAAGAQPVPAAATSTPAPFPSSQPTRPVAESNRVASVELPSRVGDWAWPLSGRVSRAFGSGMPAAKGLSIAADTGSEVQSAAAGVVVYSGNGLRGYGNLVIVKHSETLLTAYAHNSELLVGEGDQVHLGQTIARVGRNPDGNAELYFELRLDGKPVDPVRYLPTR